MMQTKITRTTAAILALFFFFQAGISHAAGRLFILGIDESGSYVLRDQTMSIVKKFIIKEMQLGDTLFARRITDESYPDIPKNLLLPKAVILPELDPEPKNRFDPSAKKKYIEAQRRINLIKKKMIVHIQNQKPLDAPKTDIYGFLAACAERLAYSQQYTEKFILIASDMKDNCRRQMKLDLAGARVMILAFQKETDPAKTKKLREQWIRTLKEMSAKDVTFLGSDQDLKLAFHAQSNQ
jgi:hypothetical protein